MSSVCGRMDRPGELGVAPHPVAVAPDVDDMAAVERPLYGTRREPSWTPGPRVAAIAPAPCPPLTFRRPLLCNCYMAGNT